jgi:hypothetical protein
MSGCEFAKASARRLRGSSKRLKKQMSDFASIGNK